VRSSPLVRSIHNGGRRVMSSRYVSVFRRAAGLLAGAAVLVGIAATPALAQLGDQEGSRLPLGERYHVELSGTLWNPTLLGVISSEQFGIIGDQINLSGDLGYRQTRFKDLRLVLRPGRKSKFRFQYTPISYTAATNFSRDIVFNGIKFPVSVPIDSTFEWKVMRVGYEYDVVYTDHGYVGLLLEGRYTQFSAALSSILASEFTRVKVPLPALGVVGRAYVAPGVAINFEVSGFQLPEIDPKYDANYYDWDIHGTVNFTNNVGVQIGWRRMTTYLFVEQDTGDLKFQGMWFGAAVRY
jgi:hypothetical protein